MIAEVDFTNDTVNILRNYGGANGPKKCIVHNGELYMLKMPPKASKNPEMSYANSCFSEYIACHIFESVGIEAQKTLLGRYGDKIAVACKDFVDNDYRLQEFAFIKNSVFTSARSGYGTDLSDVILAIREQQLSPAEALETHFWNMFIVVALVGNFDRHNGNWGFLVNEKTGDVKIAPVFDCGSCLLPQATDENMRYILDNKAEMEKRIYSYPTSALQIDEKKINYAIFLNNTDNAECLKALEYTAPKIDLTRINDIIDSTPYITDIHRQFLKAYIKERKEKIIDKALLAR
ncbi:MAG: HipA domain-containing protein [Clostridiales bacterium]|jgi:hypothetical protein|nr:HipA domain-containing protein [Clostridiales bacterium]